MEPPYNENDLDTAWAILEGFGIPRKEEISFDEIQSLDDAPAAATLVNPLGEKIYTLEGLEKLSILFNVTSHKNKQSS